MTIDNNISLRPSPSECNLNARQNEYFDNLTKDIELLKLMLAEIKEKVDGRDTLINTGTVNADTVNAGNNVSTKDLSVNGNSRVQGKATFNEVYIENSLVLGDLAKFTVKLINVAQLLVNKADIEEADIKSAIIDTLKLKVELQRYDNNQNIVSFPSEAVTQLGDIANNIVLAGFDRPKWNDETIAIDSDIANKYYNKTEINNLMDEELIDDLHRETDIIKGNTPVQKVAAGCVDTEGNILATADDAFMLYGAQGRDNIPRNSSLNDLVVCGQYNAWKYEVADTISDKPDGETGPFDLTVGYSLADRTMPYQMYTGLVKKSMYIRFYNADLDTFDSWQQFQFMGGSTRPQDVGNAEISLKPEYGNELNIYGNNTSKGLTIGARGNKKDVYKFGENASSEVQAKKFTENGKDVAVIDDFLTNAFALNNIPLKANDDIDNLPLGTYATVDFSIFSQIKGNKPFNSPFKLFVFKGGKETAKSSQQLAIDWTSEQIAIRHTDGTSWTAWVQLAMLDSNGYVEKAKNADIATSVIDNAKNKSGDELALIKNTWLKEQDIIDGTKMSVDDIHTPGVYIVLTSSKGMPEGLENSHAIVKVEKYYSDTFSKVEEIQTIILQFWAQPYSNYTNIQRKTYYTKDEKAEPWNDWKEVATTENSVKTLFVGNSKDLNISPALNINSITRAAPNANGSPFPSNLPFILTMHQRGNDEGAQLAIEPNTKKMKFRGLYGTLSTWQEVATTDGRVASVGNDSIYMQVSSSNEINFGGDGGGDTIVFGQKELGNSKPKRVYIFGKEASAEVRAKKFIQNGKEVAQWYQNVSTDSFELGKEIDMIQLFKKLWNLGYRAGDKISFSWLFVENGSITYNGVSTVSCAGGTLAIQNIQLDGKLANMILYAYDGSMYHLTNTADDYKSLKKITMDNVQTLQAYNQGITKEV